MLQFIITLCFGVGCFLILCNVMRVPKIKTVRAVQNVAKRQKKKSKTIDMILDDAAIWLSKYIRMNEYKRMQLLSDLQTARILTTPEKFLADALIKAFLIGLLAIPSFLIMPLISPVIVVLAVSIYFQQVRGIEDKIKKRREAIEYELPRLVFTIAQVLQYNRDVLSILEKYRETAGEELKHELNITVADMRSSNYENALTRLETRVGSTMLSDVVRGLIGVLRGDETGAYWRALSIKFSDIQRQMLKREAAKVPGRVKKLSFSLLGCFMVTYLVVIVVQIYSSLGAMFG